MIPPRLVSPARRSLAATPLRRTPVWCAAALTVLMLGGCSTISDLFSSDKNDYRTASAKSRPLEVPPDLSQLARDSRWQLQTGVVSASGAQAPGASMASTAAGPAVAAQTAGNVRVERSGQDRWLVVPLPPEQVWPTLRAFWEQRGFTLAVEDAKAGIMETNWAENKRPLPEGTVRTLLNRAFGALRDTGERDLFRTRVERTSTGTEIYVAHQAIEEVWTNQERDSTRWRARPSDPQLEAEFLSLMMVALGSREEVAKTTVATAPQAPARARLVAGSTTALELDDPFDRAWRRIGLALDRGGFTVEDRDRSAGLYFVRWVDPRNVGKEEPGWWSRLFGNTTNPQEAVRYRVALRGSGEKTTITVLTSSGGADVGENGQRIASLLVNELR